MGERLTPHEQLAATFSEHWGRLLSLLAVQFGRLDLAEDGLAEAFASATTRWPRDGAPGNPPGWLMTTARRKILDRLRTEAVAERKQPLLIVDAQLQARAREAWADPSHERGGPVPDERLRLIFLCAHPRLPVESAAALTLRLVLGVSTAELARLFLVSESAMAARLTRAKRSLAEAAVPLELPEPAELAERLSAVAAVCYLAFTAGYAPTAGSDPTRVELAGEAIRLTRLLRDQLPRPEFDALLALMLLQHSRRDARVDAEGDLVLLPDQDRSRWRSDEIAEGLSLLDELSAAEISGLLGEYVLQARIAAEHAVAVTAAGTRWDRIAGYYAELERLNGSAVVRLNRAVAVASADGPAVALALLDGLDERLPRNSRLAGVRAHLLAELGRTAEARDSYDAALAWCRNEAEAAALRRRRDALPG